MKKFKRLVGILLCFAMVLSFVPATIIGAVSIDTVAPGTTNSGEIIQGQTLQLIAPNTITPSAGYYQGGTVNGTFVAGTQVTGYTDGWYYEEGKTGTHSKEALTGIILTLQSAKNIGGVQLISSNANPCNPTVFTIQVLKTDGTWQDVKQVTSNPFTTNGTVMFTFDPVEGTAVRLLITDYATANNKTGVRLGEIELYEAVTGNTTNKIDLAGLGGNELTDGNKTTWVNASSFELNLTKNGYPTTVDKFMMYAFRNNSGVPTSVTIAIKKTSGGSYETIGTFSTGWSTSSTPVPYTGTFSQSYDAYAMKVTLNGTFPLHEFELYQYVRGNGGSTATEAPTTAPTQAPTVPTGSGEESRLQYKVLPAPSVGYYVGEAFTSFAHNNGGSKMVDADVETWGGSQTYTSGTPTDRTPAIVFDLTSNPLAVNGLEIMVNDKTLFTITDFDIQVQTTAGGAWETVATAAGNPFVNCCTQSFMFNKAVVAYGIRIMIKSFNGNNGSNFFFAVQEITPWVVTNDAASVKVPAASATVGIYANSSYENWKTSENAPVVIDGEKRVGHQFSVAVSGTETPAALLTLAEAAVLNRVEVFAGRDGITYTPTKISVEVMSNGAWVKVGTYESGDWDGAAVVEFTPVEATQVRVLAENVGGKTHWNLPEIELYGPKDGTVPEQPTEPTEPTETPTQAPTQAPTAAPSVDVNSLQKLTLGDSNVTLGYYSNANYTGAITSHLLAGNVDGVIANMLDGNSSTLTKSEYFQYTELPGGSNPSKYPALLINLPEAAYVGALDIYGCKYNYMNIEDFDIQVFVDGDWKTVASVTGAWTDGEYNVQMPSSTVFAFDGLYYTSQIRVLVHKITDMTVAGGSWTSQTMIRIRELAVLGTTTAPEQPTDPTQPETQPGTAATVIPTEPVGQTTAKLNGVDISYYSIVYSDAEPSYTYTAAQYIQTEIKNRTGRTLQIVEDNAAVSTYEILVGQTNRDLSGTISAPANNEMKFTITSDGQKVAMEADYFIIAGAAYYFVDTYISTSAFENVVPTEAQELAPITKKATNYIFMIGDGMGYNQTKIFDKMGATPTTGTYGYGDGEDIFYGYYFPNQGSHKTMNAIGQITDSAAGGTALATGYKTLNQYVGMDRNGNSVKNMSELALELGKSVAVMSTEAANGATPSDFSVHHTNRNEKDIIKQKQQALTDILFIDEYVDHQQYTAAEWNEYETKVRNALNTVASDSDGFFIMYEEAHIDHGGHYGQIDTVYRAVYRLNQAIGIFMEYAMYNPDTFVLITADHETSGMTADWQFTQPATSPSYPYDHSAQDVPVFAYGEGADIFDGETVQNASIGRTFAHIMTDGNADNFGDPTYPIIGQEYSNPTDPNAPTVEKTDVSRLDYGVLPVPQIGYYVGDTFTKFENNNGGSKLVDLDLNTWGGSGVFTASELVQNGGTKTPAIVFDMGTSPLTMDGLQIISNDKALFALTSLTIQVKTTDNGAWETVYTSGAKPFASNCTQDFRFGKVVDVYELRVLVNSYDGNGSAASNNFFAVQEIVPWVMTKGIDDTKVPVANAIVGVYTDGTSYTQMSSQSGAVIIDGDKRSTITIGTTSDTWVYDNAALAGNGGNYTPAAVLTLAEETYLTRIEVFAGVNGQYWTPSKITAQVLTADGWTTVGQYLQTGWEGMATIEFAPTKGSAVRILVDNIIRANNTAGSLQAAQWLLPEITVYGVEGNTEPEQPTEPTEPTQAPTEPATQAPSVPATQTGDISRLEYGKLNAPSIGYYVGSTFTSAPHSNNGTKLVDKNFFTWGGCAAYSNLNELVGNGGTKTGAIVFDQSNNPVTLNGLEIMANGVNAHIFTAFDIQVQTTKGGAWETVYSATDAFTTTGTMQCMFDKVVTAYGIRVMIKKIVGGGAGNIFAVQEITPWVMTTGVVVEKVPVQSVQVGVYTDGLTRVNMTSAANGANLIDGEKYLNTVTVGAGVYSAYDAGALAGNGGAYTPAAILTLAEATWLSRVEVFQNRDGLTNTPSKFTVQVKNGTGEWITVGTYEKTGWPGYGAVEFEPVEATQVRVLVETFDRTYTTTEWVATEIAVYAPVPAETETNILVGASYSVHLIEPWALRTYIQFANGSAENLIPVSEFTSYGAYAIIGNKFAGTTAEELMADPDAVHYTSEAGNITAKDATTLTFDFYDGLYSYNLGESVYWVAYFETADGTYYTAVQEKSLIEVADSLLDDGDVTESEKAVLSSMKEMRDTVIALRGESADLGNVYDAGIAISGSLGDRTTGYAFGTSHQIKLIEPWGVRVRVLMRDKSANKFADYEGADDYGLIFFHDKTGKYGGSMTAAQMNAESGTKVYSKMFGNAVINAGGVTAVYDNEIFTYDLDSELYCLPYIVVKGDYYYPENAICWNLLAEMETFSENENLDPLETAVFDAMLDMYDNVQAHLG